MHIHTTAATPAGDSLAGFQAAQTAAALRRARELNDAAARLKARSVTGSIEEDSASFASLMAANPATQSQSLSQAVVPVAGRSYEEQAGGQNQGAAAKARDLDTGFQASSQEVNLKIANGQAGGDSGNVSSQGSSVASTQETPRASPSFAGDSASNSNDWLRPVSFWA